MSAALSLKTTAGGLPNNGRVPGHLYEVILFVTGDASYPAGGYPLTSALILAAIGQGLAVDSVDVVNDWFDVATTAGTQQSFRAVYDSTNSKLLAQAQGTAGAANPNVDVTATTDLHLYTATLRVRYR